MGAYRAPPPVLGPLGPAATRRARAGPDARNACSTPRAAGLGPTHAPRHLPGKTCLKAARGPGPGQTPGEQHRREGRGGGGGSRRRECAGSQANPRPSRAAGPRATCQGKAACAAAAPQARPRGAGSSRQAVHANWSAEGSDSDGAGRAPGRSSELGRPCIIEIRHSAQERAHSTKAMSVTVRLGTGRRPLRPESLEVRVGNGLRRLDNPALATQMTCRNDGD